LRKNTIDTASTSLVKVLHIVRRYGPVGGMEGYVWALTQKLADMGCRVSILCETRHADSPENIRVYQLGDIAPKPRWLAALRFSDRAKRWLAGNPHESWLIHSHETTDFHHIATFHGPPFAHVRQRPFWRNLSLRVQANLWLEQKVVCARSVRAVIPNSDLIRERLQNYYPCIGSRMTDPILPGVEAIRERPEKPISDHGGIIGFVGKEWKRKGLDIVVDIVREMRKTRPQLELHVAGPKPETIRHLFADWQDGYKLLGETNARPLFQHFDLLLHPARMEPFGMVITEALSARVPVIASDQCGARSEIRQGRVLKLDEPIGIWAKACLEAIGQPQQPYQRRWEDVAQDHHELYQRLSADHA